MQAGQFLVLIHFWNISNQSFLYNWFLFLEFKSCWSTETNPVFQEALKNSYSWLPKGGNYPILNLKWKGVVSIVSGILTNGGWIALVLTKKVNSKEFWLFWAILERFITSWVKVDLDSCYIMLDNAPIHQCRLARAFLNLSVLFFGISHLIHPSSLPSSLCLEPWRSPIAMYNKSAKFISEIFRWPRLFSVHYQK